MGYSIRPAELLLHEVNWRDKRALPSIQLSAVEASHAPSMPLGNDVSLEFTFAATISLSSSIKISLLDGGRDASCPSRSNSCGASLVGSLDAEAEFNCFATPGEGVRCACIGLNDCSEMKNSDSCKSDPECDKNELGAISAAARQRALQKRAADGPCEMTVTS